MSEPLKPHIARLHLTDVERTTIKSYANVVLDTVNRVTQMDTPQRREDVEWAKREFAKRCPGLRWQDFVDKDKSEEKCR
jgi:Asp-tRNA(Asn)/Glu-tRNA(Gln) amidotransferase C subunit